VGPDDAGELLTLQRATYVSEARLYDDVRLPPLTQTYDELSTELARCLALKAIAGRRMVGAVRARLDGSTLHIRRLVVAPDLQGQGIGTRLLAAVEQLGAGRADTYALFTGDRSVGNIRLYERLGYVEVRREQVHPELTLVHLTKPLR
jgi:GNAT superfamily N-acetyltransferase